MFQFCYVTDSDLGIETVSCRLSQQMVRMDMGSVGSTSNRPCHGFRHHLDE